MPYDDMLNCKGYKEFFNTLNSKTNSDIFSTGIGSVDEFEYNFFAINNHFSFLYFLV